MEALVLHAGLNECVDVMTWISSRFVMAHLIRKPDGLQSDPYTILSWDVFVIMIGAWSEVIKKTVMLDENLLS